MVNIAISGLGEIAFSHYRGITGTKNGKLAGVYSHGMDRAGQIARQWKTRSYDSFEKLANDPDIDAIVVCSADKDHCSQAITAMKNGKHVLVEKPLALSLKEVVDMARVSEEEKVVLFPVHNYLFRPKVARARELIRDGAIGDPGYASFMVTQRMEEDMARRYHGALFTQAYHSIYVSNFLLGTPVELQAMQSTLTYKKLKSDDLFVATVRYENGAIGNIIANWCANDISRTSWMWLDKIVGTEGVITISSFDGVSYREKGSFMMSWTFDYQYSFVELMRHFVDDVLAGGQKPLQTPYDAAVVTDMMEKLQSSARTGEMIKYSRPSPGELFNRF
ncbi:MAG: Gfo/Idh/MocA family oxidoreductase [Methanocella sp.]